MNIVGRLPSIDQLPTLPEVAIRVLALVNNESSDADSLARIIERDPALTTKLLKVANSSFYGSHNSRFSSVKLAVARLGFNEVRDITVAVSILRHFSKVGAVLDYRDFWRHSLAAAYLARKVAEKASCTYSEPEKQEVFLAGLLHDIGIIVLDQFFHDSFKAAVDSALEEEKSYLVAERHVLGNENHATIGGALLELWRMETVVSAAVRWHHMPEKSPEQHAKIVAPVSIAEYILCSSTVCSFEGSIQEMPTHAWNIVGLDPSNTTELFESADLELDRTDALLDSGELGLNSPLQPI